MKSIDNLYIYTIKIISHDFSMHSKKKSLSDTATSHTLYFTNFNKMWFHFHMWVPDHKMSHTYNENTLV